MENDRPNLLNRRRLRFSLLSAFMLTTIIALALTLALTYAQLVDANHELANLRREMGWVTISDTEKVHAVAVETNEPFYWKWRLYLPPLPVGEYHVNCYSGRKETIAGKDLSAWLDKFRRAGPHWEIRKKNDLPLEGEITIEARLIKKDGYWRVYVHPIGDEGLAVPDDWLDDGRKIEFTNGASTDKTTSYWWGDPVMLLCIQDEPALLSQQFKTRGSPPVHSSNTIILWINKRP